MCVNCELCGNLSEPELSELWGAKRSSGQTLPTMSRHNLPGLQLNSDWEALETVFQSELNPFEEKPWLEGFPFARRAGGSGSNWIVRLFSKLSIWHCFFLIGQVGSDFFVYAAFLQVLRVRNSFGLSRQERFKRGISVAMMMKTLIPRTNSRNIWIL